MKMDQLVDDLLQKQKERKAEDLKATASRLIYFNDCGTFVQKRWIMKGLIARGETSGWIAPPGAGKSALLAEIAVHCAACINWRGHKAKQACGVLVLALERADLWKRRMRSYAMRDEVTDLPIAIWGGTIDLMNPACVDAIVAIVREAEAHFGCSVGLIIIDTYNKGVAAGGGDEDKARDQNRVAANLRQVEEICDVHIALVGHTGKDESRGARGSNAHLGDVDVEVLISGDTIKEAKIVKANDCALGTLAVFRLEPFDLGHDEDDEKIQTWIVSRDLLEASAKVETEPRLTADQKTMLRILHEAEPRGLTTSEWNEKARVTGIGKKRKATLYDIQARLKELRLVREYNGIWKPNKT